MTTVSITYDIPLRRVLTVSCVSSYYKALKSAANFCPIVNEYDVIINSRGSLCPYIHLYLDFVECWRIECQICGSSRKLQLYEVTKEKSKEKQDDIHYYQECCKEPVMDHVWPLSTCRSRQPLRGYYILTKITDNTDKRTLWHK